VLSRLNVQVVKSLVGGFERQAQTLLSLEQLCPGPLPLVNIPAQAQIRRAPETLTTVALISTGMTGRRGDVVDLEVADEALLDTLTDLRRVALEVVRAVHSSTL